MEQIGFLGVGNMGGVLAACVCEAVGAQSVLVSSRTPERAAAFAKAHGCIAADNTALASRAKVLFLGVKPQQAVQVLSGIADTLRARSDRFVLVSMLAGVSTQQIAHFAGGDYPVLRIMPSTSAAVGAGMIPYCANKAASPADTALLCELLKTAGVLSPLPEELMDAACVLGSCVPAFIYILLESLADTGGSVSLPREIAMRYAAQAVLGAAKMVLETGKHPWQLKDEVCSPGGSTAAGVRALEKHGFTTAAAHATLAAFYKTKELGKL